MTGWSVDVVVDGGHVYGLGHLSRSQTLARELQRYGFDVRFSPRSTSAASVLTAWPLADHTEDLRVFDLPYADNPSIIKTRLKGRPTVVFDHFGQAQADIAIRTDPELVPMAANKCFYGPKYAIIKHEVKKETSFSGDYVLVCIGGSDVGDQGLRAAEYFAEIGIRTMLVRGPYAALIKKKRTDFEILYSPQNFGSLLAGCLFAVTNAGTTALEAMYLGKAVHVLPQNFGEHRTAMRFHSDGLILGVGLENLTVPDPERAGRIAATASEVVDGQGSTRLANIFIDLLKELRL